MNILDKLSELPTRRVASILPQKKYEYFSRTYFLLWARKTALALFLLLFLTGIYLYALPTVSHTSDNASILLQAFDLIHASKILKGWYLPTDNFITLDMPLYALGLMLGLSMHTLMRIVPMLLYIGVMLSGIYLATLGKKGKQRLFAVLAFMAIAAFPAQATLDMVLEGPMHVGTILATLLAFIAYYFSKERPYKVVSLLVLGILTILLVIGDPMSEVIMVLPILLVEGILLLNSGFKSRNQYATIGTVLLGTLLALYMRHVWEQYVHIATYTTLNVETIPTMVNLAQDAAQVIFLLFNANVFQKDLFSLKIIPQLVNAVVVLLLAIGIWKWRKKIFSLESSHDALTAVFVFAILANIVIFICTDVADGVVLRYLLPVFIFGGIIALPVLSYIKKPELYIAIIGLFLLNGSSFFYMIHSLSPINQPEKAVISFLQKKHLTEGIGQYWSAASITGQSNYTITVRQVKVLRRQLHPYLFLANDSWFHDDALKNSQFVIYRTSDTGFYLASIRTFGKPAHTYTVGDYIILTWNAPLFRHTVPGYHFYTTS